MASDRREVLRSALSRLLMPVVRFAVRHGFRIQDVHEASKLAFLSAAEEEIERGGHEVSISKLAVVSGIHRRDVMRLWRDEEAPKTDSDVVARIIGQWQGDKRFQSKGKPKTLQLSGVTGDFRELVFSISRDLNPYTVLFELERAGAVHSDENGIQLITKAHQISGDVKKGLNLLGADSDDLMSAVTENLFEEPKELNLHIRTEFDNIPPEFQDEIRTWMIAEGARFHKRVGEFLAKYDRDTSGKKSEGKGKLRAVLGSFSFTEALKETTNKETTQKDSTGK